MKNCTKHTERYENGDCKTCKRTYMRTYQKLIRPYRAWKQERERIAELLRQR